LVASIDWLCSEKRDHFAPRTLSKHFKNEPNLFVVFGCLRSCGHPSREEMRRMIIAQIRAAIGRVAGTDLHGYPQFRLARTRLCKSYVSLIEPDAFARAIGREKHGRNAYLGTGTLQAIWERALSSTDRHVAASGLCAAL
jgi:hypothetical protein